MVEIVAEWCEEHSEQSDKDGIWWKSEEEIKADATEEATGEEPDHKAVDDEELLADSWAWWDPKAYLIPGSLE